MKHNNIIDEAVRNNNFNFNKQWISDNGFIGETAVSIAKLDVSDPKKLDANSFMMVWLKNIQRLCKLFNSNFKYKDFSLVDVGCGSGLSTLFFNQNYPFDKFLGFDFSPKLISLANQNKIIASKNGFNVSSTFFNLADAKYIKLPSQKIALFMFNPFGWETMEMFITNNYDQLCQTKSILLYANDIYIDELLKYGTILIRDSLFNLSVISFK